MCALFVSVKCQKVFLREKKCGQLFCIFTSLMVPKLHQHLFPKTASQKWRLTGYKQFSKLKYILTFVRFLIVMQIFTNIPTYKFSYVNKSLIIFLFFYLVFFPFVFFFSSLLYIYIKNIKICALCKIGNTKNRYCLIYFYYYYTFIMSFKGGIIFDNL